MLVALSAVVLGGCALFVSIVQVQIMREEQHAAVWPRIQVARSYSAGNNIGVLVTNPGIGPAVIGDMRVEVDATPVFSWNQVLGLLAPDQEVRDLVQTSVAGRIIPAGETVRAFFSADPNVADALGANLDRLRVRICYCSVYDQCWWTADPREDPTMEPIPTDACEPTEATFNR